MVLSWLSTYMRNNFVLPLVFVMSMRAQVDKIASISVFVELPDQLLQNSKEKKPAKFSHFSPHPPTPHPPPLKKEIPTLLCRMF
jgi:hypothetical protein